jgi:hypothetical protein
VLVISGLGRMHRVLAEEVCEEGVLRLGEAHVAMVPRDDATDGPMSAAI